MTARYLVFILTILAVVRAGAQQDSVEWFPEVWVRTLPADFLEKTPLLRLPFRGNDSLLASEALWALFPGSDQGFDEEIDGDWIVSWSCPACAELRLQTDAFLDSADVPLNVERFPFERNYTRLLKTLYFQGSGGVEFALVSFTTAADWMPSGRSSFGVLALALFEKGASAWELRAFHPAVDANGSYMTAVAPDTVWRAESEHPLFVAHGYGAAGPPLLDYWPLYSHLTIYAVVDGKFEKILREDDTECVNVGTEGAPGSHWQATFTLKETADWPELFITRKGRFEGNDEWKKMEAPLFVLPGLEQFLDHRSAFDFFMTTHFVFKDRQYWFNEYEVGIK